ncbi:MAG: histidine--tRNA ligase [Candidatus Obscuribacterales bacterium]|nr:histidine--tRNA ligase [Candidatus Obscuribacterales bacterium]
MSTDTQISSAPQSGMRDFLPREVRLRDWAAHVITEVYEQFGFTKIETPCLENIALLKRGDGGENLQLIFEILKRGDKLERVLKSSSSESGDETIKKLKAELADMGLRFDLTVPLVRFYSHNQQNLPNPFKSIQIGSVWRAESAQQGRYRQFTQCDIDIFGVKSELAEVELLQATSEALLKLGFENFTICLNDRRLLSSLAGYCGFAEDRFESVFIALDKLDKIGLDGVSRELAGQGHSESSIANLKNLLVELSEVSGPSEKQLEVLAGKTAADTNTVEALMRVISIVKEASGGKFNVQFEPSLVRGMGYYTGPIFEIKYPGYNYSIAGGGRYDRMVGKMSGRDVPACGFSIGFERIIGILMDENFEPQGVREKLALIFDENRDNLADVMKAAANLRSQGYNVLVQSKKKDMKKQIDQLPAQAVSKLCLFKGDLNNLEIKSI